MRVLFTFAGGAGHFLPLLPIARALAAAGDEVAFGAQAALLGLVEQAGFAAFDTGGDTMRDPAFRAPLRPVALEREYRVVRDGYAGRVARQRTPAILDRARRWAADLLVSDEMDFGGPVAAECLSLPHATVLVIASGMLTGPDLLSAPLQALRAAHGLPPDPEPAMLRRDLVLAPFAPSLRDPSRPLPRHAHVFRPEPAGLAAPPALSPPASGRPLVYVTLGTIFNTESGDLFQRLLAGLRDLPVEAVVAVGAQLEPAEFGPQPGNIRIERFVDPWSLLPRCDLVVSHAGSGTVQGALAHGLPMVLLPMGADQPFNARRCEALGVARVLDPVGLSPRAFAEAAAAALADEGLRAAARRVQAEIAALPGQETAITLLRDLPYARRGASRA